MRVLMTVLCCCCFQGQSGQKEKRVTEGTEERKETGVQLGLRENPALAPAHVVEPVERRYGLFLNTSPDRRCDICIKILKSCSFERLGSLMMQQNIFKPVCLSEGFESGVKASVRTRAVRQMNTRGSCRSYILLKHM